MKTIGRIAVILLAALAVVGATVALSNAGMLNSLLSAARFEGGPAFGRQADFAPEEFARGEGQRRQFDRAFEQRRATGQGLPFEGNFERRRFGEAGFGGFALFGAFERARNLIIVLVIVAVVIVATQIWRRLRRSAKRGAVV